MSLNPKEKYSNHEAITILLATYSESTLTKVSELEAKIKQEEAELDEDEKSMVYFKDHLMDFFLEYSSGKELTK